MNVYRQSLHRFARRQPNCRATAKGSRPPVSLLRGSNAFQKASISSKTPDERLQKAAEAAKAMDVKEVQKLLRGMWGDLSDPWSREELHSLQVVDHLIPPSTLWYFTKYMKHGTLPDGRRTSFPLLTQEESLFQGQPFSTWAPSPWNQIQYSHQDEMSKFYAECYSGVYLSARSQVLKSRLWSGMLPMSDHHWRLKKLDDPDNCQQVVEFITEICLIFVFLNVEATLGQMRQSFNWLAKVYGDYESAINTRREQIGIQERVNIRGMWAEYMRAILDNMSNRTHQWLVDRVEEIQIRSKNQYDAALYAAGTNTAAITAAGKKFFETIQDLNLITTKADYVLNIPMQGFESYSSSTAGVQDLPLEVRRDAYYKLSDAKSWESYLPFSNHENRDPGFRDRKALMHIYEQGRRNRADIRKEFRGKPTEFGARPWVSILKPAAVGKPVLSEWQLEQPTWGFVCYRLFYDMEPEEWDEFKKKVGAELVNPIRANETEENAGLQWLDGKELGIEEGDLEGAKKHFATFSQSTGISPQMCYGAFLVVDRFSYLSYKMQIPEKHKPYGDNGGHVRLIDPQVYDDTFIKKTCPGFSGSLKILTSLVLDEIYPLVSSVALRPKDFWPLARLHPNQVYVGPTVAAQEIQWDEERSMKALMMPRMFDYIENKQGEAKVKEFGARPSS